MPPLSHSGPGRGLGRSRAASPRRTITFDPWNSVARGHQRADNGLAGSIGWRETREAKLAAQLRDGLGTGGGERVSDLVGRGALDEGLGFFMSRDQINGHAKKENRKLNTDGGLVKKKEEGDDERIWLQHGGSGNRRDKRDNAPTREEINAWDGRMRVEKICWDVRKGNGKRGREDHEEEEENGVKKIKQGGDGGRSTALHQASDDDLDTAEDLAALEACIDAVEDNDDIWGVDEQPQATLVTDTKRPSAAPDSNANTKKHPAIAASHDDARCTERQKTPPSGQTQYASPTSSPPPPQQYSTKKRNTAHSNVIHQTTGSILLARPKPIFAGLTVHVSGPTLPLISDHALRGLLIQHGATLVMHLARRRITHVVLGRPASSSSSDGDQFTGAGASFAAGKLQREMHRIRSATGGPGIRFVSIEWVLDSIKAGIRLSEARFGIGMEQADTNSGPLSKEEREAIGSNVMAAELSSRRANRRAARAREMGDGKAKINGFQKGLARQSAAMPGAPPGVPSVRSLFLKQHRDNAWTKAGFTIKK